MTEEEAGGGGPFSSLLVASCRERSVNVCVCRRNSALIRFYSFFDPLLSTGWGHNVRDSVCHQDEETLFLVFFIFQFPTLFFLFFRIFGNKLFFFSSSSNFCVTSAAEKQEQRSFHFLKRLLWKTQFQSGD